jgi:hypothetical protein
MTSRLRQAASELGKIGGPKGGRARALALSSEDRAFVAAKAAEARWHGSEPLLATHSGVLTISGVEIACHVLEDGRRVLSQSALQSALGMSQSGGKRHSHRLGEILEGLEKKGLITSGISIRTEEVIRFSIPGAPKVANGVEASVLVDLCKIFLEARRLGVLSDQARHIAERCELLLAGFAHVGLLALVDEVTGFQLDRARDALTTIFEEFIAKELRPWVSTFPAEFYKHVFRLHGWEFEPSSVKRPGCVGYITTDLVYQRLAPGVLAELKRRTPRDDKGRPKHKLHQWLSEECGHPKLREHLTGVVYLLKASSSWRTFKDRIDLVAPRYGDTLLLDFGELDRVD